MYARSYFGGLLVGDQLIRNSIQTTFKNWHTKENFFSSITFIPNHTNGKWINDFMLHIDNWHIEFEENVFNVAAQQQIVI